MCVAFRDVELAPELAHMINIENILGAMPTGHKLSVCIEAASCWGAQADQVNCEASYGAFEHTIRMIMTVELALELSYVTAPLINEFGAL